MPESKLLPAAPVALALSASLCAFGLCLAEFVVNAFARSRSGPELEYFMASLVSGGFTLVAQAWLNFVLLAQFGRHLCRDAGGQPWRLVVIFALLFGGFRYLSWQVVLLVFMHGRETWPALFASAWSSVMLNGAFLVWDLAGAALCAWLAWMLGARPAVVPAQAGTAATTGVWAMQALTLGCGMFFFTQLVAQLPVLGLGVDMNPSAAMRALVREGVPLLVALPLGLLVYACWPRRLQCAAGWTLFVLGWLVCLLSAVPSLGLLLGLVFSGLLSATFSWYLLWLVYVFGLMIFAAFFGLLGRGRRQGAVQPA